MFFDFNKINCIKHSYAATQQSIVDGQFPINCIISVIYFTLFKQIFGTWYGYEIFMHHNSMKNSAPVNPCVVIQLSDATYEVSFGRLKNQFSVLYFFNLFISNQQEKNSH